MASDADSCGSSSSWHLDDELVNKALSIMRDPETDFLLQDAEPMEWNSPIDFFQQESEEAPATAAPHRAWSPTDEFIEHALSVLQGASSDFLLQDEVSDMSAYDPIWEEALSDALSRRLPWQPAPEDTVPDRSVQHGRGVPDSELFRVTRQSATQIKTAWNGRLVERSTDFDITHSLGEVFDINTVAIATDNFISQLVTPTLATANIDDYVSVQLFHDELESPIYVSYTLKRHFAPQSFLNTIFKFAQSGISRFLMNGHLTLRVSILRSASGGARRRAALEIDDFFSRKENVVEIVNDNNYCGYLAITLGYLKAEGRGFVFGLPMTRFRWHQLTRERSPQLRTETEILFNSLGIDMSNMFNLSVASTVQTKMPDHQLIIIQRPQPSEVLSRKDRPLFKGPVKRKQIIIEYDERNQHYNYVKTMEGYKDVNKWCTRCWCSVKKGHMCPGCCKHCGSETPCEGDDMLTCNACNVVFATQMCYHHHLDNLWCGSVKRCPVCEVTFATNKGEIHKCDTVRCKTCRQPYSKPPHYCFIKPLDLTMMQESDAHTKVFIAFDIEARLVEIEHNFFEHRPNLLISHTVCDKCYVNDEQKRADCSLCGKLETVYFGDECVRNFIDFIMNNLQHHCIKKRVGKIIIFAHNFKGYDGRFVLEELFKRKYIGVETVFNGTKIVMIDCGIVRFIDSLSFLPLRLEKLPNAFPSRSITLQKGCFPHLFNKEENYSYVGPWPALVYYQPESKSVSSRRELEEWHASKSQETFHFMDELIRYCRMDVMILLHAFLSFRKLFRDVTQIDPTTRTFTLAAAALETFRARHLAPRTIGITPIEGYIAAASKNCSIVGSAWLDYQEKLRNVRIIREKPIGVYFADGFDDTTEPHTVYEFFGCLYHGCPICFPNQDAFNPIWRNRTNGQLLAEVNRKLTYYQRRGFNIIASWEHDVKDAAGCLIPQLAVHIRRLREVQGKCTVTIRESLFGGRTENVKLMYNCLENERLRYLDFTSLYPFVLKNRRFPTGHPDIMTDFADCASFRDKQYFGFAYVTILPPRNLFLPVLPYRSGGKLLFGLCRSCMDSRTSVCRHEAVTQRALTFCYTTCELDTALDAGYELLKVHAVIHYPTTEIGLFKPYIDLFLKIKQQASGIPPDITNEEGLLEYIQAYANNEGIVLDRLSIEKNEGLRWVAKIMLNSLWGKLAQRPNMPKTTVISDYETLSELVNRPNVDVMGSIILPNDNVVVTHRLTDDKDAGAGNTSTAIACFVTAWARLELYNLMRKVESVRPNRVCYLDTDSLIFIERDGDPEIRLGNFLGELTDEIEPGFSCRKGVFAGCKSYALQLKNSDGNIKNIVKVKGLSLSSEAMQHINFDSMEQMVSSYANGTRNQQINVPQCIFRPISRANQTMTSRNFEKAFHVTTEKRWNDGCETYPYGYICS